MAAVELELVEDWGTAMTPVIAAAAAEMRRIVDDTGLKTILFYRSRMKIVMSMREGWGGALYTFLLNKRSPRREGTTGV